MESPLFIRELLSLILTLADDQMLYLLSLVCKEFHFAIMSNPTLAHKSHKTDILKYAINEKNSNLISWSLNNKFRVTYSKLLYCFRDMRQFELASKCANNEVNLRALNQFYNNVDKFESNFKGEMIRKIRILESSTKIKLFVVVRLVMSMIIYVVVAFILQLMISKSMYDNTINFIEHMIITFENFFLLTHKPIEFMSYRVAITVINIIICVSMRIKLHCENYYNVFILTVIENNIKFNYAPFGALFWSRMIFFILVVPLFI